MKDNKSNIQNISKTNLEKLIHNDITISNNSLNLLLEWTPILGMHFMS